MRPIQEIATELGVGDALIPYGFHKGKLPLALLERPVRGKLVLVTAMTPTPAGEGKTTTTIGLVQALHRQGASVIAALREPSLGPCFGIKGGGTGGGSSKIEPSTSINLHFNGDLHAITAAHNLIAALVDNHLHFRKSPAIDPRRVVWKRVLDQNDRALRNVVVGLGGGSQGVPRESGFDITAASEVMAMLCLATSVEDLRARLGRTLVGFGPAGEPITVDAIGGTGAALALLAEAIQPNLVQTTEGAPALVHGGPFANIAHGCNSIIATRMGMRLADWTVTEAGFGSDLGAEKFFHIACQVGGFAPAAVVVVATVRALKYHGGAPLAALGEPDVERVRAGLPNLFAHLDHVRSYGHPVVVAINRFPTDSDAEVEAVRAAVEDSGVPARAATHFADGGAGAEALAELVQDVAAEGPSALAYTPEMPLPDKLDAIARRTYGADGVTLGRSARRTLKRIRRLGLEHLPVCMAKTSASLSDDPALLGRPEGFSIHVRALQIAAGAGFIVALSGDILRMPGLPKEPTASRIDLVDGRVVGVG